MDDITIILTKPEAITFREYQKRHDFISYLVNYMEAQNLFNLPNSQIVMNIDNASVVREVVISKSYKKL